MGSEKKRRLGEILLEEKLISREQLNLGIEKQKVSKKKFGEILAEMGFIREENLLKALSSQLGNPAEEAPLPPPSPALKGHKVGEILHQIQPDHAGTAQQGHRGGWYWPKAVMAATTPATSPGTVANDAAGGTQAWTSPGNASASDNTYASINNLDAGVISKYLKATNFGFAIPAGSTILGITVQIDRFDNSGPNALRDNRVSLVKGGAVQTTNKASATIWPAAEATATYGGAADLWGTTWTAADINNANFGVVLSAIGDANKPDPRVDWIRITIDYSSPGTLQFSSATYTLAENGGTATITVSRTGGSVGAASVNYATSNGTATQPGDYTTASGTLNWVVFDFS